MQEANSWLEKLLHIREGTPYQSNLIVPKELRTQASTPESSKIEPPRTGDMSASDDLKISGITIFQLGNGVLTFEFFVNNSILGMEEAEAFAGSSKSKTVESKVRLQISNLDFSYPVRLNNLPSPSFHFNEDENVSSSCSPLEGSIITTSFGRSNEPLDSVAIWFYDLSEKWWGDKNYRYYQAILQNDEIILSEDSKKVTIPCSKLGYQQLGSFDFKVDGWSVSLREIPHEIRGDSDVTHFCEITRQENIVTGEVFREFIKGNLITFLSFLFGQNIFLKRIEGRRKCNVVWVEIFEKEEISPRTLKNNWFLKYAIHDSSFDIEQQFQNFCRLPSDVKKQWQKVIHHYFVSEEIAGTLHEYTAAASVSFSALEGLTRSIINTYPDRDQWLKKDLRLKQGKGILDAIKMVAEEEFGKHSKVFRMASQQIREVRNATVHLDLVSDEDPRNAFYRWNASQALIEFLMLKKLGMKEIPNRTIFPTFRIYGEDMFADQRKEELRFDQGEPEEEHP
ncbi:MAG: hypothetical protein F4162_09345 [Synechococcus sp. SB0676_bin_10]|uniref:ApeA N-terminal domain-containing protein n=1 Tax=Synechococcus sp. SB0676_bin_10 TaxID=2604869 RepID=A0A6B1FCZ1_9SYNE|nr:hypothetical protein [Synechococcus sp. SB0676_bin_10]